MFRDMFTSPAEESGPEGKSEAQPIQLPGVTKEEFKALLDYFYLPFVLDSVIWVPLLIFTTDAM